MNEVSIKSAEQLALMRQAGRLLASVFTHLDPLIREGLSTMEINHLAERFIVDELQARPASKGQYGYPYALNASPNHVVCHGMPSENSPLKNGDIINIDITLEKNGYIADSSKMYLIGEVSPIARQLVNQTYAAMWRGIKAVKPGATLGDVGHAIEQHARLHNFSVVREYCGHGIGQAMHEAPQVLHFGVPGKGVVLKEGMTFTIEPMINQGRPKVKTRRDGWTIVTADKKLSAQWEHTVAVTADGYEVLTLRPEERHPSTAGPGSNP